MKKNFVWRLCLIMLALFTVLPCASGVFVSVSAAGDQKVYAYNSANPNLERKDYHLAVGDVVGQRIKINSTVNGFGMCIPTYATKDSDVTLSAYVWRGDYASTMAAEPIASKRFENCGDGAWQWLWFDNYPAGEYFFAASDVSGDIGVYRFNDNSGSLGLAYINGLQYSYDFQLGVNIPQTATMPYFAKILSYKDTTDGENQAPPEYKIPEDSYIHRVQPSTWVFTDGLGRESLTYDDVGAVKSDKIMAMFFWDWHDDYIGKKPMNIQSVMDKYPEAKNDYDNPAWPEDKLYTHKFFWNEPIYGYYSTTDSWVLRRQAELLANAGVDTVFMDNSNDTRVFANGYTAVFEAWEAAMEGGVNSPKVSFHLPMWGETEADFISFTKSQMEQLYLNLYQPERHQKLWFYYEGKPMLIAYGNHLDTTDIFQNEIKNFFTFRSGMASYFDADNGQRPNPLDRIGTWGWSSAYPQAYYYKNASAVSSGVVEEVSVSVAENYDYINRVMTAMNGINVAGKSYSSTYQNRYLREGAEASKWGYNFAEQWNYALNLDPNVIFVTGWNEWTVRPLPTWCGVEFGCADQFDDEYSRDIEPTKGALKDHYYYQLVNFSRKFQGAEPIPQAGAEKSIFLTEDLQSQLSDVYPYFGAYKGNTGDREALGSGKVTYTEYSGRNDIIGAQVSRDSKYLYFAVECAENITSYTDKLWMNLYIDSNQSNKGWETFDFVVNKTAASATTCVLERFTNGYASEKVADVEYTVDGRFMVVKIEKSLLGISGTDFTVNFAWTDNVHDADDTGAVAGDKVIYSEFSGDIMDFYTSGDVAPGARFKYSYIANDDVKLYAGDEIENMALNGTVEKYGQKFTVSAGERAVSISIPFSVPKGNNAGATFKLYKWNGSYSATVASAPLYTEEFTAKDLKITTFTIPESTVATGTLYWEVTHAGKTYPSPLGAKYMAKDVVNYISGVENGKCTGYDGANTIRATVKTANENEYVYAYVNSIDKSIVYSGELEFGALSASERAECLAALNKYAGADGFRSFTKFSYVNESDGVRYYYSEHNYADSILINGEIVDMDGASVVAQTEYVKDGVPFYGWEDKNGNIISNYATFKYYPSSMDDTLTAVYRSGDKLEVGVGVELDRTTESLTVTVTPVRNKGNTIVEYGYFIGVDMTFENYGTVSGNALNSIAGATKVTAKEFTSAYLQRIYNMSFNTYTKDISVIGYVTYTDAQGNTYTYYSNAKTAAPVHSEPSVDVVDPDVRPGGWL